MKVFIILCFAAIAISVVHSMTIHDISEEWNVFKIKFNKAYKNVEEELFRKNLYLENKIKIEKHNKLYKKGQVTYKLGMNKFGDMTIHEISAKTKGFNLSLQNHSDDDNSVTLSEPENLVIPSSIDWREKGAVTPVKNQGHCQSAWAFSSTGALEAQHFRKTGKLVKLSEQNLIDCSDKFGNGGCFGGIVTNSFKYVKFNKGIDTEESYPYEAENRECRYIAGVDYIGATARGYVKIMKGSEKALTRAVATVGPVSAEIDGSSYEFFFYEEGVLFVPTCSSKNLNRAVLVVGYNTTEAGEEYWIVKNSWGEDWGQGGYVWMARNKKNNCGIASMACYPLV